jgi:cytochrome c biogenesis protein CcmG/thiol:disulfide interchange protein DsbE
MKSLITGVTVVFIAILFWGCPKSEDNSAKTAAVPAETPASAPAAAVGSDYGARTKRPAEAAKASPFSLPAINGAAINIADFKGKVVILDFWATWCPPCRAEIPDFIAIQKEYTGKDFAMLGAAVDDAAKVKNFVKANKMNYPVFIVDQATSDSYGGIRGIPTTFVIDREGYIVRQYVGYRPKEVFEQDIKDLM